MRARRLALSFLAAAALVPAAFPPVPASALGMKECSARYRAARDSGRLAGRDWDAFRRSECGAPPDATVTRVPNPLAPDAPTPSRERALPAAPPATDPPRAPLPRDAVGYPDRIDPRHAGETAGTARRRTCLDAYRAAKAAGREVAPWTEPGGGYYSACNRRLSAGRP